MKELQFPPTYCSTICRNALNERCIEQCNTKRDMSAFELKKGVELPDLPAFPLDEFIHTMTPRERQNLMAVYMAKTVDFIQGRKEVPRDYPLFPRGRTANLEGSPKETKGIQSGDIYTHEDGNSVDQNREENPESMEFRLGEIPPRKNQQTV
jgi:hypothetical protein